MIGTIAPAEKVCALFLRDFGRYPGSMGRELQDSRATALPVLTLGPFQLCEVKVGVLAGKMPWGLRALKLEEETMLLDSCGWGSQNGDKVNARLHWKTFCDA